MKSGLRFFSSDHEPAYSYSAAALPADDLAEYCSVIILYISTLFKNIHYKTTLKKNFSPKKF